ncbi:trefoil factor 2 isoform X1 [Pteropus medius]|uniref:trefoil factor 2 isoform X1 n=1 Tax=Pteropus vampyrus TaxID=132908 RepID=UPI00196B5B80|nr:trefoil factor 2 isoform X1 [Pteropus giganteus]
MDVGRRGARLLAAVLVLGLCAPAGAEKPSPCQCSRTSPQTRKNCGFPGITSDQCFKAGCCFDSSVVGVPWCFDPLPKQESEECVMEVSARRDCGYPGISPQECASRKCCFSDVIPQVPWCFFPLPVQGTVTVDEPWTRRVLGGGATQRVLSCTRGPDATPGQGPSTPGGCCRTRVYR